MPHFPYTPPASFPMDCVLYLSSQVTGRTLKENWAECGEAAAWIQVYVFHNFHGEEPPVIGYLPLGEGVITDDVALAAAEYLQENQPPDDLPVAQWSPEIKKLAITLAIYVLQKAAEYLISQVS